MFSCIAKVNSLHILKMFYMPIILESLLYNNDLMS